ncbi:pyridoxal-phosphate dependent enzyme [Kitasatospora sp. GP82]|uniref:pyridoxal-phosphate dependent enzyme n=1 Tax=Kitasatospora sp. GP82 TaxID=3035089 RepID=UPI00247622BB|nr:pyridoxal-phosphate dependent enzyme [Kitasatospora sp. GP82]MDH6125380.1 cysteine synthase/biotin carboxylase [Kitasatospora sp. GP82]
MRFESITDLIGHTPLVRLAVDSAPDVRVYAKLELQNPYGMKDRVAQNIILRARQSGELLPGAPIVESSSGTMALGVALVGAALGHEVHIVTDPRIDRVTLAKLRALGCRLHIVETMTSHGWQSARLECLQKLLTDLPGAFWPQQYTNPDNPAAYRRLAEELIADLGHIDLLVGSVGSGGSLCGSSRALRAALPDLRVLGVDCVGSVLFDQPDRPGRLQSGLGNSLLPKNLDRRLIDEIHWLNDHEAFAATRRLAAEQQIFGGNTSGSVYRVLRWAAERAAPGSTLVGILPDRGDRYAETVFDDEHWQEKGLAALPVAASPRLVGYGTTVESWSRAVNRGAESSRQYLLLVESNTTGTGMLALHRTRELGLVPVLLTSAPERYAGLAEAGCEVLLCETNRLVEVRAAILDRFRREELAGVATTSEFYVPAVAELTAWLGLAGNPAQAVATCREKGALREALAAAGVHQPRFAFLAEGFGPQDVRAAVEAVGLPCVVKPVDDSGSNGVLRCESAEEVGRQAESILAPVTNGRGLPTARRVLVEEYLDGPELSVELFGADHLLGITDKQVTGEPYFVETRHLFPAELAPPLAEQITDTVRRAVAAAGLVLGASHTEVKLTPDGPAIIEINPRLAGGMIPELIRLATGVEPLEQQLRAAGGLPAELEPSLHRHAGIRFLTAGYPGVLDRITGCEEARAVPGIAQVTITAKAGSDVTPARNAYDRLGYLIAHGDRQEDVLAALDEAERRLTIAISRRTS